MPNPSSRDAGNPFGVVFDTSWAGRVRGRAWHLVLFPDFVIGLKPHLWGRILLVELSGAPGPGSTNTFRLNTSEGRRVHSLVTGLTPKEIIERDPRAFTFPIDPAVRIEFSKHVNIPWIKFRSLHEPVRKFTWTPTTNNLDFVKEFVSRGYPNNVQHDP